MSLHSGGKGTDFHSSDKWIFVCILTRKHGKIKTMKSLFSSKTFWLAFVQGLVGVIGVFATTYPTVGGLLIAKSIVDIVLRVLTVEPVTV